MTRWIESLIKDIAPWGKKLSLFILLSIAVAIGMSFAWKGSNSQSTEVARTNIQNLDTVTVTDEITEWLLLMREEEKLAHDVYVTLYEKWGLSVFDNISNSEQKHTDSVKALLDRYWIEDPVTDNTVWVFVDEHISDLYDALVSQGNESLLEALKVGAIIEDLDIKDLNEQLENLDETTDIYRVYTNLRDASYNHLLAFVSNIEKNGGTRDSEYLEDAQLYQEDWKGQKGKSQWKGWRNQSSNDWSRRGNWGQGTKQGSCDGSEESSNQDWGQGRWQWKSRNR